MIRKGSTSRYLRLLFPIPARTVFRLARRQRELKYNHYEFIEKQRSVEKAGKRCFKNYISFLRHLPPTLFVITVSLANHSIDQYMSHLGSLMAIYAWLLATFTSFYCFFTIRFFLASNLSSTTVEGEENRIRPGANFRENQVFHYISSEHSGS